MDELIELTVQVFTGGFFKVKVKKDATVRNLIDVIGIEGRLGADKFVLSLDSEGRRISLDNDNASVKDYGVKNGSHVYLFLTIPETAPSKPLPPEGWPPPKIPPRGRRGGTRK